MQLHPTKQSNADSTPRERRRSRSATLKRRARHITLSALSIAVLALALIITSMLATDSASAQTTNADGSETLWETTLTTGTRSVTSGLVVIEETGFSQLSSFGSIEDNDFSYSGSDRTTTGIHTILQTLSGDVNSDVLTWTLVSTLASNDSSKLALELDGIRFPLSEASRTNTAYTWSDHGLSWADNQSVTVKLVEFQAPASAPTNLTTTTPSTTQIGLSWSDPYKDGGAPITGHKIEVSSDAGNNWTTLIADTGSTLTTHAPSGFVPGDTRHFRVSAINKIGTGPASGTASATATRVKESNTEDLLWTADLTTAATTDLAAAPRDTTTSRTPPKAALRLQPSSTAATITPLTSLESQPARGVAAPPAQHYRFGQAQAIGTTPIPPGYCT